MAAHVRAEPQIQSVVIRCDLPRCHDADEMRRLLSLSDLARGNTFSDHSAARAEHFLMRTGLFDEVNVSTRPGRDGNVLVVIETTGRRFIRKINIEAGFALESEIRQRIFMRPGEAYNHDEIQPQIETIVDLFEDDGYHDTRVTIITIDVDPYLVDLLFLIEPGTRFDIRHLYLRGHQAFSYEQVRSIIFSSFGFFRTFNVDSFESGLRELVATYRRAGHIRARVLSRRWVPNPEEGVVDLFVELREGPRWEFTFSGNRHFTSQELYERLTFEQSGIIDREEIQSSAREFEAFYRTTGYYFVEVNAREEWLSQNEARVIYTISEGARAEIRRIDLVGNHHFSRDTLMARISTREYGVLETGGYLQPAQVEADARAIESFYIDNGFLSAFVSRWTVLTEDDGNSLYLTLFIHEGVQTLVEEINFRGNSAITTTELLQVAKVLPGMPFSPSMVGADLEAIERFYNLRGYNPRLPSLLCITPANEEVPNCQRPRFPEHCRVRAPDSCTRRQRGSRILIECGRIAQAVGCEMGPGLSAEETVLEYHIQEGELVTIGEIFLRGNFQTDANVIHREFLLSEGQPFSLNQMYQGVSSLRSLGLFNAVSARTIGYEEQDERFRRSKVAIVLSVEEKNWQFVEFSLGIASQNTVENQFRMIFGTQVTYANQNFLGRAEELRVGGHIDFDLTNLERISDGEFILGTGIVYLDPRFYWFDLAIEPWESEYSLSYYYDLVSVPQNRILYALNLSTRRAFVSIPGFSLSLEGSIELQQTRPAEMREVDFENHLIFEISPGISLDRRDNALNPTSGYRLALSVDLGADIPIINENGQTFGSPEDYTQIQFSASHFVSFARHFIFGSHLKLGFALGGIASLFSTPEDPNLPMEERLLLPPGERFRLGGVLGMRGFPDHSLGPTNSLGVPLFGDVLLNGVLEIRYPLIPSANLFGATYVETGQLSADYIDLAFEEFRFSAGLGIRWLAFGLVPVILDYGLVLDRRPGEEFGQLHFNVGYTF